MTRAEQKALNAQILKLWRQGYDYYGIAKELKMERNKVNLRGYRMGLGERGISEKERLKLVEARRNHERHSNRVARVNINNNGGKHRVYVPYDDGAPRKSYPVIRARDAIGRPFITRKWDDAGSDHSPS